jgi:RNA polymerase sigma factor (sigma-70 family)
MRTRNRGGAVNATLARLTRITGDPATTGDGFLLDAFLTGDQGAFALLVRRHAALVYATCQRILHHTQDAEDAFQATFLVLARRAADVWPREAVGSWLFGVAHRVALKARTVRSRRHMREQPLEEVAGAQPVPPDFDLAEAVHRVVSKLPEVYRAAVVACDLQGLSRKEAAERLGWSEGTLSGRLARARELLARRFRRMGLALPAGGLLAVLNVPETVCAAALQNTIGFATGTAAAGASGPVLALTEGVVRNMVLFKVKVMTAALFVACALGLGAFAASESGAGAGADPSAQPGNAPKRGQGDPNAPIAPKPADPPPPKALRDKPAKPVTDRDRLQGTWRVVSLTEGGKTVPTNPKDPWVIEVRGNTFRLPYLEGGASPSNTTIGGSLGGSGGSGSSTTSGTSGNTGGSGSATTSGGSGTNTTSGTTGGSSSGSGGLGTNTTSGTTGGSSSSSFGSSAGLSSGEWKQREYTFTVDETKVPRTIDLVAKKVLVRGIYEFTLPAAQCSACHRNPYASEADGVELPEALAVCAPVLKDPRRMSDVGVRLALSMSDARPEKFGGDGVIVLQMKRQADVPLSREEALALDALAAQKLLLEEKLRAEQIAAEKARLEAELKSLQLQTEELLARRAHQRAQVVLRQAQAELEVAKASALAAQAELDRAVAKLEVARQRVGAAEKAVADLKKPQPQPGTGADAAFTLHVRPLTEAEKVVRVKSTGKETVLEGLAYATEFVSIKASEVSVWVVRNKEVLPVDLPAITRNADAKTNYTLKTGDQLFIQIKPGK